MIIYFSASGNSRAVAERLGELLGEEVFSLLDLNPQDLGFYGKSLGFVFPIYSWGVPPIVTDFIHNFGASLKSETRGCPVWAVMTCGDDVAKAPEMFKKALSSAGLQLSGGWSLQMPNTYVLLPGFDVDSKEVETDKLIRAYSRLKELASKIENKEWEEKYVRGSMPGLKSGLIFPLFKRWGVFPDRWHATDKCIGCGECAELCPESNIKMVSKSTGERPEWGSNCISCLACYHVCPRNAVQYGNATRGKGQYRFRRWKD